MKYLVFNMIVLFLLASCKPGAVEKSVGGLSPIKPVAVVIYPTTGTAISLVSPTSSPNNNSSITFSISGVVSGESVKIYPNAACNSLIATKVATGTSVSFTTASLPIGVHKFYTNSTNSAGTSACSTVFLTYQFLGVAPTVPTSIALSSPVSSPDTDSTPTFTLGGVVSGETIKLYRDVACSQLVGSTLATGATAQITSTAIAPGSYSFYATSTNIAGTSSCSTTFANYQYLGVLPTSAATLTLSGVVSPNYLSTPTFLAANGVAPGDTVKIYSDITCSTLVGSAVASSSSVSVTLSPLAVAAAYNFYTNSTNVVGTSACSGWKSSYNYLGPAPVVQVSWNANREKAVNSSGGGYKVYYSTSPGFNLTAATVVTVPYVSGALSPTSLTLSNLLIGTYYFKIVAFSALNPIGGTSGSTSLPSAQFSVSLP